MEGKSQEQLILPSPTITSDINNSERKSTSAKCIPSNDLSQTETITSVIDDTDISNNIVIIDNKLNEIAKSSDQIVATNTSLEGSILSPSFITKNYSNLDEGSDNVQYPVLVQLASSTPVKQFVPSIAQHIVEAEEHEKRKMVN